MKLLLFLQKSFPVFARIGMSILVAVVFSCSLISCSSNQNGSIFSNESTANTAGEKLVVACGDDMAGFAVREALARAGFNYNDWYAEALSVGDCCGSNAQFALATGDVDIAVLCPDAAHNLIEDSKGAYCIAETLLFDGNVLLSATKDFSEIQKVGYMSDRNEQLEAVRQFFQQESITYHPLYSYAMGYALVQKKVDAAVMDAATALLLDYSITPLTHDIPTSVLVTRSESENDKRVEAVKECIARYFEVLQNENEQQTLITKYVKPNNEKEAFARWKTMQVRFNKFVPNEEND